MNAPKKKAVVIKDDKLETANSSTLDSKLDDLLREYYDTFELPKKGLLTEDMVNKGYYKALKKFIHDVNDIDLANR